MLREWRAGEVDPDADAPEPATWEPVTVPGKPSGFAGADAVAYRTTFDDPRSGAEEYAMLVLEGLYAHAAVRLNGSILADHDAYFEPLRVRLGEELAAENELTVVCRRPTDRFGGIYESDHLPETRSVPGIWWDARLEPYDECHLLDLSARPRVDDDGARFEVRTTVVAETPLDDRVTFSVRPEGERRGRGMMNRAPVEAAAGERTTVEHTIEIRDPALWWPRDLGEQHRYVLRAKLGDAERTLTTGLCSITDDDGLRVNGRPISGRGVSLLDADPADVERAREVNANVIRTRAHVPRPAVFEAADEAGLLVWTDLPLIGPGSFDVDHGRDLLTRTVETYDHHPSLAAVGVHDEPVALGNGDLGAGFLDRLRLRWRMWRADYDRAAAETVAEAVPDGLLSLPVVGPPGIDHDATALYPGWQYGESTDVAWLLDRYPHLGAVVGAFGAASLGSDPAADDVPGFDRAIHDRRVDGDREASQAYQRTVLKTVAERLRLGGTDLLVAAALRDPAGAGMGVYTDEGEPKLARDALEAAFEPIQVLLSDPRPGVESDVVVRNDAPGDVSGEVTWEMGESAGDESFTLEGNSLTTVTTVAIPSSAGTATLTLSLSDRSVENLYQL